MPRPRTMWLLRDSLTCTLWFVVSSVSTCVCLFFFFFFFQAEDGIRDLIVTGVQTCALPIYSETIETRNALPAQVAATSGNAEYRRNQAKQVDRFVWSNLVKCDAIVARRDRKSVV